MKNSMLFLCIILNVSLGKKYLIETYDDKADSSSEKYQRDRSHYQAGGGSGVSGKYGENGTSDNESTAATYRKSYNNRQMGEDYFFGTLDYNQEMCIVGQHAFERTKRDLDYISNLDNLHDRFGVEAKENEFPWMVMIHDGCLWESMRAWQTCGGTLISPTLVLSANHCIKCNLNGRNDVSYALLGVHHWSGNFVERTWSQKMFIYFLNLPEYKHYVIPIIRKLQPQTLKANDIAIMVLERPARLSNKVCPILLPSRHDTLAQGKDAIVAGWGLNASEGELSLVLRKCNMKTPTITNNLRENSKNQCHWFRKRKEWRCYLIAIPPEPCGPCTADSGGPLMIKGQDQGYFVYGTVSAGYGECDTKELFNNALFFMDWIKKTVEIYEQAMCKTKLWTQRSSRKWIARMKNGCEQDLIKFAGHCVHSQDKHRQLTVVKTIETDNAGKCSAQCQNVDDVKTLHSACQYTSSDRLCKFILDDVSYGSGENNNAACFVFGKEKPTDFDAQPGKCWSSTLPKNDKPVITNLKIQYLKPEDNLLKKGKMLNIKPRHSEDCILACIHYSHIEATGCEYNQDKKTCFVHGFPILDTTREDSPSHSHFKCFLIKEKVINHPLNHPLKVADDQNLHMKCNAEAVDKGLWRGPFYTKLWGNECENTAVKEKLTLEQCKYECMMSDQCNVINFGFECAFLKCSVTNGHIPKPSVGDSSYVFGYCLSLPEPGTASNYGCHPWTKEELGNIITNKQPKKEICESKDERVWLGGPAEKLRLSREQPIIGCKDCNCCRPNFGSMYKCHPFKPNDQKLVTNNGADAVKLCNDMGGFWSYGVPEAFPGCGGCFCCKQVQMPDYECHVWSKREHDILHGDFTGSKAKDMCKRVDGRLWNDEWVVKFCGDDCKCCRPVLKNSGSWNVEICNEKTTQVGEWVGPFTSVWSDQQCSTVGTPRQRDLELCQQDCWKDGSCNAIHFKEGVDGDCVLRHCAPSIGSPATVLENYTGFCVKKKNKVK